MRTKTNSGSVVLKAAAIVLGACLTIIGMTSAVGRSCYNIEACRSGGRLCKLCKDA